MGKKTEDTEHQFTVYLSSKEAAAMAGVEVKTVNNARQKGDLHPASRTGSTWGYLESEVHRWMNWREENPPESRRWGWNGSGTPRPHGVEIKEKKDK